MTKEKQGSFAEQLPVVGQIPLDEFYPRLDELQKYREWFFDPRYDGFENDLTYLCDLPIHPSKEVASSPLGVGFEVLDHRCGYDFQKALSFARNTGVKWARLQSGWQRAEKEKGVYDFGWLDEIVDGLLEAGIQPWISLSFGNGLYMDAPALPPQGNYFYSPTRFGEEGVRGWTNYCRAMAEHFRTRVFHWEVWNEPNVLPFLQKPFTGEQEEPEVYVELVAVTAKALKEVQPEAKIIGGAFSGGNLNSAAWLHGFFRCGLAEHIDIFSYHPYSGIPELNFPDILELIRGYIRKSGRKIAIWQGENGRPSNSALLYRGWKSTEGSQARYLTRRYLTDLRLGVDMTSYFLICDIGNGYFLNGNGVHGQGVIDAKDPENYHPKLAYRAMQSFATLFDSRTERMQNRFELSPPIPLGWGNTTMPLHEASGITCAFRRGDTPIFAYYHPTNLDADWSLKPVIALTWLEANFHFSRPILIDPITGKVYRIARKKDWPFGPDGTLSEMARLPLLDYPLFVSDASLLDNL